MQKVVMPERRKVALVTVPPREGYSVDTAPSRPHSSDFRDGPLTERSRIVVRVGDIGDIDEVAPLFDAYRAFYGATVDPAATREFLTARVSRGESVLLVASIMPSGHARTPRITTGTAVGFAHLYPMFSSVSLRRVTVLNDLFVASEWRRAGIARELIASTAAFASSAGAVRVELATQRLNVPARQLYQSLGFAPDDEFVHMSLLLHSSELQQA
jgi:GNAT superfamily N-acetyltransferase